MRPAPALPFILSATLIAALPALAQDPGYLDDRSSPGALVASLYNAIGRHEYARAYGYFGQASRVAPYEVFAGGYADTRSVDLLVGTVEEEGAAGSLYGRVPVALVATAGDGSHQTYGGCYITRLGQPANQEPPFVPIEIVAAKLVRRDAAQLADALPARCAEDGTPGF